MTELKVGSTTIRLVQGDITKQDTQAIVNAANSTLMGGGGVDGAIHRAGGPEILEACKVIIGEIGRCNTGEAVITGGGNLPAKFVIHTVGPVWNDGTKGEPDLLRSAYRNSLALARVHDIHSVAFPSISTGAYHFPVDAASEIALRAVHQSVTRHPMEEIRFVLFSDEDFATYQHALSKFV